MMQIANHIHHHGELQCNVYNVVAFLHGKGVDKLFNQLYFIPLFGKF
jgi:hypothetical protein